MRKFARMLTALAVLTSAACTTARGGGDDDGADATDGATVDDATDGLDGINGVDGINGIDGAADATDGTTDATDTTDGTTDATDGTDGATDSTDGTDGVTDATDGTDGATDATDGTDGLTDSTDGTDGTTDSPDGTTDSTDGSTDATDGTDSTDGSCTPVCEPGWKCGSNGCGGDCGVCAAGANCNLDSHLCEYPAPAPGASGSLCGPNAECNPSSLGWPGCLDDQCAGGWCRAGAFGYVCTESCTPVKDVLDADGNAIPDGVEDPGVAGSECADIAKGGPYGPNWTCVTLEPGAAVCQPGSTFLLCTGEGDCPDGEACHVQYITEAITLRCSTELAGGEPVSASCNDDPATGAYLPCQSTLCLTSGCTAFCNADADCISDGVDCVAGKCTNDASQGCSIAADCAAFQCEADTDLFDGAIPPTGVCLGKPCESNANCPGPSHCTLFGNGETGAAFALANSCTADAPGAVGLGQTCETDSTDAIPLPECAGLCLGNGQCSSLCTADSQCAGAAIPMFCNVNEETLDLDDDGTNDAVAAYGLCLGLEGSKSDCGSNDDCPAGEVCDVYQSWLGKGAFDLIGRCVTMATTGALPGENCGGDTGILCRSGFCIPTYGDGSGLCGSVCDAQTDCLKGFTPLGAGTDIVNMRCESLRYSFGGTLADLTDDVFVPVCVGYAASDSMQDCAATLTCTESTEACVTVPRVFGATGPAAVDYMCIERESIGGEAPTAALGQACDPEFASASPADHCIDLYCLEDTATGAGFCSKPCATDGDCAAGGLTCQDRVIFERGTVPDVTAKFCLKAPVP